MRQRHPRAVGLAGKDDVHCLVRHRSFAGLPAELNPTRRNPEVSTYPDSRCSPEHVRSRLFRLPMASFRTLRERLDHSANRSVKSLKSLVRGVFNLDASC